MQAVCLRHVQCVWPRREPNIILGMILGSCSVNLTRCSLPALHFQFSEETTESESSSDDGLKIRAKDIMPDKGKFKSYKAVIQTRYNNNGDKGPSLVPGRNERVRMTCMTCAAVHGQHCF